MDTRNVCSREEEKYYKEMFARLRKEKHRFTYEGPVIEFGLYAQRYWCAATYAVSSEKALSNIMHQYRMEHGLPINAKIGLPGTLVIG